jgi:hypothetical protein
MAPSHEPERCRQEYQSASIHDHSWLSISRRPSNLIVSLDMMDWKSGRSPFPGRSYHVHPSPHHRRLARGDYHWELAGIRGADERPMSEPGMAGRGAIPLGGSLALPVKLGRSPHGRLMT